MTKKDRLILDMLQAIDSLGYSHMARVEARVYHRRFNRRARKLGIRMKEEQ